VAAWRLALVKVMQYIEGLTDHQAADAVRRCMEQITFAVFAKEYLAFAKSTKAASTYAGNV
jgi:hypothetical protein